MGTILFILAVTASSYQKGYEPKLAVDHKSTTAWCAAESADETASDWWQAELSDATVGAIHMKSGIPAGQFLAGHKVRRFVWTYQRKGESEWHAIPETDIYANRYQLIFRFKPIHHVERMRLVVAKRDSDEKKALGANNPCLREVDFYAATDAKIPTAPWFYAVSTWEDGANIFAPLKHWDWRAFRVEASIQKTLAELSGESDPDTFDEMWIGEFNQGNWMTLEPRPAGFLFSGNYKEYYEVHPYTFAGFYDFVRAHYAEYPMFGACGGHQLLAMAFSHPTMQDFSTEFAPDSLDQTVVTCSTNPQYGCGNLSAKDCCYEGGFEHPFKRIVPNTPELALANDYQSSRVDMLFNLLPENFHGYLFHSDYVNPAKIAPYFDIIATYPKSTGGLSRSNPTLVQAMKLKNHPVYGSQFHWDENLADKCDRAKGYREMDRVLKNFTLIALNRLNDRTSFKLTASSNQVQAENLHDLDRASEWCSAEPGGSARLTFEFNAPTVLKRLLLVEGDSPMQAKVQRYSYEYSLDGKGWKPIGATRQSLFDGQKTCDGTPGRDDHQSFMTTFEHEIEARYLRMTITSPWKSACLREIFVLKGDL